jgi:putative flippase GtrA
VTTVPPRPKAAGSGRGGRAGRVPLVVRQLVWYAAIGGVMTLAYLALYAVLRGPLGAQPANAVAWIATAIADTAANRRLTFGISGRSGAVRAQGEGLLVFALGLAITSGSLGALDALVAQPGRLLELAVLLVANLVAGLVRFLLLRTWVFAPRRLRRAQPAAAQDTDGA